MQSFQSRIERLSQSHLQLLAYKLHALLPTKATHASIVACVVGDDSLDLNSLKRALQQELPDYMVPATLLQADALPLLPNGKLDRQQLLSLQAHKSEDLAFAAPRNPTEQTLADIWATVLGVDLISVHDNFFEIGGDSILSIQIIAQARKAGLSFSPNQLFEHQTIAALAEFIHSHPSAHPQQPSLEANQLPSGFEESGLSQEDLDTLLGTIG
ncbi:MAG: phosphopantetheine-binding protein [Bacteroidota bacterium]